MSRRCRARVDVRLLENVNDPQGNAVGSGLLSLGHDDVRDVRIGKIVELTLEASDVGAAHARVEQMCDELLVNATIESFNITIDEDA